MANSFYRDDQRPENTYQGREYKDYRRYKTPLREDFKSRCGYTNCIDHWFGGKTTFQIDHFLPQSKHPHLRSEYGNLIYCCSFVNRAKSDDEGGYLNPWEDNFNEHFYRTEEGEIRPKPNSDCANYMYKKLKLYLRRYSIIWVLEQLEERMEELRKHLEQNNPESEKVKELFIKLTLRYMDYKKYLRSE